MNWFICLGKRLTRTRESRNGLKAITVERKFIALRQYK